MRALQLPMKHEVCNTNLYMKVRDLTLVNAICLRVLHLQEHPFLVASQLLSCLIIHIADHLLRTPVSSHHIGWLNE